MSRNYPIKQCIICGESYKPNTGSVQHCPIHYKKHYVNWSLDYKRRVGKLCAMAKNRAKAKNLNFNLTPEYMQKVWEENQGCCALTGIPFELKHSGSKGQVHPDAPSIDRISPKLGYIEGNVRLITYHMNVALSEFGVLGFERLIKAYGVAL